MLTQTQTRSAPTFPNHFITKHSKTFTGCWTCRARKVKCDELRPCCRQCLQKGIDCEGYDVRLQWMPPETTDGSGLDSSATQSAGPHTRCHRSKVILDVSHPQLFSHEIDAIMLGLDSLEPSDPWSSVSSSSGSRAPSQLTLQCFGVFDSKDNRDAGGSRQQQSPVPIRTSSSSAQMDRSGDSPSSLTSSLSDEPPNTGACPDIDLLDFSDLNQHHESHSLPSPPLDPQLISHQDALFNTLPPPPLDLQAFQSHNSLLDDLSLAFDAYDGALTLQNIGCLNTRDEASQDDTISSMRAADLDTTWQNILPETIPRSPLPNELSSQERFLLHHYANRVVHLLTTVDNPKSPWKTIHLPRALQSAGEIAIQRSTSDTKNALRNALLSVSAFIMSENHRTQKRQDEANKWAQEGSALRGKAINSLQLAVSQAVTNGTRFRYKESLATMLSMITINVMSGDTATCGLHLDGAYRLILQARGWKTKYSSKAQALHRIYFFLRTIYQSTAPAGREEPTSEATDNSSPTHSTIPGISPDDKTTSGAGMSPLGSQPGDPIAGPCSYSFIYGIPHELLLLLTRTVRLVNEVTQERQHTGTRLLSPELTSRSQEVEDIIMGWTPKPGSPLDVSSSPSNKPLDNQDIIAHTTRAFHNAIILYFAQHVRLLGHFYMQPFITKVIDSIEAIERIKADVGILATPLYWPAFIGASEAFDPGLQERFRRWYAAVEHYGIGSVRTGFEVLEEVWRRGPCPGATLTSIWRLVIQDTGTVLLLS